MKKIILISLLLTISFLSSFATGHTISITSANATCFGSCNGIANATVTGGVGPFVFAWSGPAGFIFSSGATTTVATGMCAGIYTLTATDQSDMSFATATVTITQPAILNTSLSTMNASCNGNCDGMINLTTYGGQSPFSYQWNNSAPTEDISGLCPGSYSVTVTDNMGCSAIASTVVNQSPQMVAIINSNGLSCGNCNGTASVSVSGGQMPLSFLWNTVPGQTTSHATNLCVGTYSVTVADQNNCTATTSVTISNSPGLNISATATNGSCVNSGTFCVNTVSGGVPPYTYQWSNLATGTCIYGLTPGFYFLWVYDSNGCTQDTSVSITNSGNNVYLVLDSIVNLNCNNNSIGSISVHGTGGSGIYHYSWSNGDTTSTISNLVVGYYTVTLHDSNGCTVQATYHVINTYNLYASVTVMNANCSNNGEASLYNVTGVNPPFTYLWNDPLNQTTQTASNLVAGNYSVTVTDNIGCYIIVPAQINYTANTVIKGRMYQDLNQNCVQDIGEPGIPYKHIVSMPGNDYATTDQNGDYTIYSTEMNNTVSPSTFYLNGYLPVCPSPSVLNVNFSNLCDTSFNNDFGFYINPGYFDLRIATNVGSANPGFTKTYMLFAYNNSLTYQNATIRLTYDPLLQYTSSTFGGIHNSSQHIVEWTVYNMIPSQYCNSGNILAYFYVPTTVSITDTLCTTMEILPIVGDAYPSNNTISFCQPVTGSFDPNSKDVIPRGYGSEGYITTSDSVLNYTVHFQNTGNDTAFTVIVIDTLSQFLNISSIVPGASSHPYTFNLSEHGILTFRFDHILLPDSNVNEAGSNGFFNYTVNLKPNLPVGTVIENKASIFFDFNLPIVTNYTKNTIASPLKINEIISNSKVEVYPNPFKDKTTFEIKSENSKLPYKLEVYNILGKKVRSIDNINSNTFKFSSDDLESGIYLYKVLSSEKEIGKGKIFVE